MAFFLLPLWADTFDRGWSNLGRIARDRPYTIQYRSGACISGKIAGAVPGAVSLEIDATPVQAIPRTNVARVIEFPWAKRTRHRFQFAKFVGRRDCRKTKVPRVPRSSYGSRQEDPRTRPRSFD